jgi:hypothetical protein
MFSLTIETDNAAFSPDPGAELARILHELADKLDPLPGQAGSARLRDLNGNTVGRWEYELEPDDGPELPPIPTDFPVQPIDPDDPSAIALATCGTCGRSWDDGAITSMTPTPAGRCPFEAYHTNEPDLEPEDFPGIPNADADEYELEVALDETDGLDDEDPRALESDEPPYGSFPEERGSEPDLAGDVADALSGPAGEELGRRP